MLKKLGNAIGKITLDICKGAANNAAFGFGATAAICLAYGTYSWGKEVGHRQTIEEWAAKEDEACPEEVEVTVDE